MGRKGKGHRGRGAPKPERPGPERTCCGCRKADHRDALVRLTTAPDGSLFIDWKGKFGGRGAWVHVRRACVQAVQENPGLLARSLRARPSTEGLRDALVERVVAAAEDGLSMAAAAGLLIGGRDLLGKALRDGRVCDVVVAADAAAKTVEHYRQAAPDDLAFTHLPLDTISLGARVGKGPRAALGLRPGNAATHLRAQLRRLRDLG